jgi:hypothetical protein
VTLISYPDRLRVCAVLVPSFVPCHFCSDETDGLLLFPRIAPRLNNVASLHALSSDALPYGLILYCLACSMGSRSCLLFAIAQMPVTMEGLPYKSGWGWAVATVTGGNVWP